MSHTSVNALMPPAAPRIRAFAAPSLPGALARFGRALWRQAEALGQARAQSELRRLAMVYAHQPEFARRLLEAARQPLPSDAAIDR
jgi:hypothetical protein